MPKYKIDGFPTYFHSGLTPPTSRIVEKRFKERVHAAIPPPVDEIRKVEKELITLVDSISAKESGKQKKTHKCFLKALEEVEECVVQYEPWMDDHGNRPKGIQFDENDDICKEHPEVWLDPEDPEEDQDAFFKEYCFEESEAHTPRPPPSTSISSSTGKKKKKKNSNPDAPPSAMAESSKKKKNNSTAKKKKEKKKEPAPKLPIEDSIAELDNIDFDMNMDAIDAFGEIDGMDGMDGMGFDLL